MYGWAQSLRHKTSNKHLPIPRRARPVRPVDTTGHERAAPVTRAVAEKFFFHGPCNGWEDCIRDSSYRPIAPCSAGPSPHVEQGHLPSFKKPISPRSTGTAAGLVKQATSRLARPAIPPAFLPLSLSQVFRASCCTPPHSTGHFPIRPAGATTRLLR